MVLVVLAEQTAKHPRRMDDLSMVFHLTPCITMLCLAFVSNLTLSIDIVYYIYGNLTILLMFILALLGYRFF